MMDALTAISLIVFGLSALVLTCYLVYKVSFWDSRAAAWNLRREYIRKHGRRSKT